jgi:flavin-binding protein dodecin
MERLHGVAVAHVGREDRERFARGRAVDGEEGVGDDRDGVIDARDLAQPLGERLVERRAAAHLQCGGPGEVVDGVGEGRERRRVDRLDGDDERHAARDPARGERAPQAMAAELAPGEQERGPHAASMYRPVHPGPALVAGSLVAVARVTEIIASSPDGFREAVEEGVARAARTIRNITGLEVVGKRVKVVSGLIAEYRVEMKLIFLLED